MTSLHALISGENDGVSSYSLLSPGYGDTGPATVAYPAPMADYVGETSGVIPVQPQAPGYGYADGTMDIEQLIDKQADGWTGPSQDAFVGVSYAGDPGRGVENDQLGQSAETSTGPGWTVPSEEVGIGRAPGFRWARMPHVEQHSPRREAYVDQGVFADGQPYFPLEGANGQVAQNHRPVRAPFWDKALDNPGFDPAQRYIAAGSAIIEQAPSYALSQILGMLGAPGWGVS